MALYQGTTFSRAITVQRELGFSPCTTRRERKRLRGLKPIVFSSFTARRKVVLRYEAEFFSSRRAVRRANYLRLD